MSDRPTTEDLYRGDGAVDAKSAGTLIKEVTEDLSTLIRKEIELAKQELGESISARLKGAAIVAVAGVLGFFALIFVLVALRDGLDDLMWTWLADLVTAGILLAVGIAGALFARRKLATPISTELTKQNIKEDIDVVRSLGKR